MDLTLLVILVVGGIGAIVAAVHLTGGGAEAALATPDDAVARFAADFPDAPAGPVALAADGRGAVIGLGEGGCGLVSVFGGKFVTRVVRARDLAVPPALTGTRLEIRLRDLTMPAVALVFADEGQARRAASLMPEGAPTPARDN